MLAYLAASAIAALTLSLSASSAFAFSASFTWCSGSPRFQITDAPTGTAKLDFHMTDLTSRAFIMAAARSIIADRAKSQAAPLPKALSVRRRHPAKCTPTNSR
jgi:hypothetical protein